MTWCDGKALRSVKLRYKIYDGWAQQCCAPLSTRKRSGPTTGTWCGHHCDYIVSDSDSGSHKHVCRPTRHIVQLELPGGLTAETDFVVGDDLLLLGRLLRQYVRSFAGNEMIMSKDHLFTWKRIRCACECWHLMGITSLSECMRGNEHRAQRSWLTAWPSCVGARDHELMEYERKAQDAFLPKERKHLSSAVKPVAPRLHPHRLLQVRNESNNMKSHLLSAWCEQCVMVTAPGAPTPCPKQTGLRNFHVRFRLLLSQHRWRLQ